MILSTLLYATLLGATPGQTETVMGQAVAVSERPPHESGVLAAWTIVVLDTKTRLRVIFIPYLDSRAPLPSPHQCYRAIGKRMAIQGFPLLPGERKLFVATEFVPVPGNRASACETSVLQVFPKDK